MKDAVRIQGGAVSQMPVMKVLIMFGQLARTKYKRRIEDETAEGKNVKRGRAERTP